MSQKSCTNLTELRVVLEKKNEYNILRNAEIIWFNPLVTDKLYIVGISMSGMKQKLML